MRRPLLSETRPVPQQLDLVEALVEEVLVVLDDLDAHRLAGVQVEVASLGARVVQPVAPDAFTPAWNVT